MEANQHDRDQQLESDMAKSPGTDLVTLLKDRRGEQHAVILQDFPDPDAISSALAYRAIAEHFGITVDIFYGGRVSHQENLALINVLDISMIRYEGQEIDCDRYQGCIFVDNQGNNSSLTRVMVNEGGIPPLAIIDHHAEQNVIDAPFMDIRPIVGSCASIFVEYLHTSGISMPQDREISRRLATALMHGILSDTRFMVWAAPDDYHAAARLQPHVDQEMLMDLLHQQRSRRTMEVIQVALSNRVMREGLSVAGVGSLRSQDRDAIPQAADFLLTEETTTTSIVYGIVNDNGQEFVSGSLRTSKTSLVPDDFLKDALGKDEDGHYFGGGKMMAGGFEIPLGFLSGEDDQVLARLKWEAYDVKIRKRLFKAIGIKEV
ncbi:MAG: bifunctional oligoribonuclease/PAP phosphatase NrnA [Magnetococcales bacterium]|nr:bifunctional oligoribonuclease/PAP phosphatase NrnA [Magnetococcales bacterium]